MTIITIITMITIRQNGSHTKPSDIMATGCICSALTTPIIVTMNDKQHFYLVLKQYSLHTWIGKQEMGLGSAQSRAVLEQQNTAFRKKPFTLQFISSFQLSSAQRIWGALV